MKISQDLKNKKSRLDSSNNLSIKGKEENNEEKQIKIEEQKRTKKSYEELSQDNKLKIKEDSINKSNKK